MFHTVRRSKSTKSPKMKKKKRDKSTEECTHLCSFGFAKIQRTKQRNMPLKKDSGLEEEKVDPRVDLAH